MKPPFAEVSFLYDPCTQALVQYVKLPTGHKLCVYDPQTATRRAQLTEDRALHQVRLGTSHALLILGVVFRKRVLRWARALVKAAADKELQATWKQQLDEAGENFAQQVDRLFKNPPAAIGSLLVSLLSLPVRAATLLTSGITAAVVPAPSPDLTPRIPPKQTRREPPAPAPEEEEEQRQVGAYRSMPPDFSQAMGQAMSQAMGLGKGASLEEAARKMQEGMRGAGWFAPQAGGKAGPGPAAGKEGEGKAGPSVASAEGLQEYLSHLMRAGMFGGPVPLPDPDMDMDPDPDFGDAPMMDDPDPDFDLDEDEDEYEEAF